MPQPLALAVLLLSLSVPPVQEPDPNELVLRALPLQRIDLPAERVAGLELPVILAEEPCTLELVARGLRSPRFELWIADERGTRRAADLPSPSTYVGTVREWPGSRAVASLRADGLHATVLGGPGDAAWSIQPAERTDPDGARLHVAYASAELSLPGAFCDALGGEARGAAAPNGGVPATGGVLVAELAFDTDHPYFLASGGTVRDTLAAIEETVHLVNLIYEHQIGLRHEIVGGVVRTTIADDPAGTVPTDPYASFQGTCSQLRTRFTNHWMAHHGGIHRDVAYLFSARPLEGPAIGCAPIASMCWSTAFTLSLRQYADLASALVVAHELGHVWGACHCTLDYPMSACNTYDPPNCRIMYPGGTTGPPTFGPVTVATIQAHAATFAPCLHLDAPSPAPSLSAVEPLSVQALVGGTMTLTGDELDEVVFVHAGAATIDRRHFEVVDPSTIRFDAPPAGALGPATVVVEGPGGSSQPIAFEYLVASPPKVIGINEDAYIAAGSDHTWTFAGRPGQRLELLLSFDGRTWGPPGLPVLANATVLHAELLSGPGLGTHTAHVPFAWEGRDLWVQAVLLDGGRIVEVSELLRHHVEF